MVMQPNIKLKKSDLLRCPICGRKPRVKYFIKPSGVWVEVKCKPLFLSKAHLVTRSVGEICDSAEQNAFNMWNKKVRDKIRHREEMLDRMGDDL